MADPAFLAAAVEGFLLGASLIIAIGAQNAFVLRQGLERRHVFAVALVCALSDAVLIGAGIAGLGALVRQFPAALFAITMAGAVFLAAYAVIALRRALNPASLCPAGEKTPSLAATIVICLALTWLNPHVYLDTLVLIGGLSARHPAPEATAFGIGAVAASFVWFFALAYGARLIAPWFARPAAWRILDLAIAVVMGSLAVRLAIEAASI